MGIVFDNVLELNKLEESTIVKTKLPTKLIKKQNSEDKKAKIYKRNKQNLDNKKLNKQDSGSSTTPTVSNFNKSNKSKRFDDKNRNLKSNNKNTNKNICDDKDKNI